MSARASVFSLHHLRAPVCDLGLPPGVHFYLVTVNRNAEGGRCQAVTMEEGGRRRDEEAIKWK